MSSSAALSNRPQNWKKGTSGNPAKIPRGPSRFNKERLQREQENGGLLPLDYQLQILRDESQPRDIRMQAARDAGPYLHPRLSAVVVQELEPELAIELTASAELQKSIRGIVGRSAYQSDVVDVPPAPGSPAEPAPELRQAAKDASMVTRSAQVHARLNSAPRRSLPGSGDVSGYRERDPAADPRSTDFEPDIP